MFDDGLNTAGKFAGELLTALRSAGNFFRSGPSPGPGPNTNGGLSLLIPGSNPTLAHAQSLGFRFGDKGTHTSRTMMLEELTAVLRATRPGTSRAGFADAIIQDNCLAKDTVATRRLSNQRLGELYGLDESAGVFRVLRRLWENDQLGRPLLALLCSIARDPLLAATVDAVLPLLEGEEFPRTRARELLSQAVGRRLNESTLDKVVRNCASSWSQAGHLEGRTFKKRTRVRATPATIAYGLYLGYAVGFRGRDLFSSDWIKALDLSPADAQAIALEAKRSGLIDLNLSDNIVELGLQRLDPQWTRG